MHRKIEWALPFEWFPKASFSIPPNEDLLWLLECQAVFRGCFQRVACSTSCVADCPKVAGPPNDRERCLQSDRLKCEGPGNCVEPGFTLFAASAVYGVARQSEQTKRVAFAGGIKAHWMEKGKGQR